MSFKQVFVRLEVRHHRDITLVACPAQLQNCKWQELHYVEGGMDCARSIRQVHRSDSLLGKESPFLQTEDTGPVGGAAFGENKEWRVLSSLFDQFLSVADGGQGLSSLLRRATPRNINTINNIAECTNQWNPLKLLTGCKGRPYIVEHHNRIEPAHMIAHNSRRPLDLFHLSFVFWAQIIAVVDILVPERCLHARNEEIKGDADVVHKENYPLAASILHRPLPKIMPNRNQP